MATLYTSKVVAAWLGVTERRVRQLRDEGVITETKPGLYDLRLCVTYYINHLRNGNTTLNQERTLLTKAKREAADMENKVRRGELHRAEDIEKGLKTVFLNIRSRFLPLPAKLSHRLASLNGDPNAIFLELQQAIAEVLEELSTDNTALLLPEDDADDDKTSDDQAQDEVRDET